MNSGEQSWQSNYLMAKKGIIIGTLHKVPADLFNLAGSAILLTLMSNPCVNCGKERIDGKTWEGKIGASPVTYTMTVCPDPACQKLVDKAIADRKAKSAAIVKAKEEAKLAREKLLAAA